MVVDLSATKYCDSSGLSSILVANRLCKNVEGTFVLSADKTKVPSTFLQSLFATKIELNPEESQYFVADKSTTIFLAP